MECIQGLRKPDDGVLSVLGYDPATQAERPRPLVGSQLQDSALPDRLRVAEALDLFATSRARDGGDHTVTLPDATGAALHVMGSAVRHIARPLPLTLLTNAVRQPWLGLGPATGSLAAVAAVAVVVTTVAARRTVR